MAEGLKINLSGIEGGFDPLPAGTYDAIIAGFELRETKGDGKLGKVPMLNWEFTLEGDDPDGKPCAGRKLWTNTIIHQTTLFRLKQLLEAAGWDEDDLDGDLDIEDLERAIGSEVSLVVVQREYNGEIQNDVKRVRARKASDDILP